MTVSFRRLACAALVVLVPLFGASPASAQSSSLTSGQSLLAGVKFDTGQTQQPINWNTAIAPASVRAGQPSGTEDTGIGVGVLAGLVRTSFTGGDDVEDFFTNRTGTMLGGWVGGNMDGRLGFVGEFIYLIRKSDVDFDGDGPDDELSFPAFSIPAVFHLNFGPADRDKGLFYAIFGPVFTINLKQEVQIDGEGEGIDVSDEFNGADIGAILGAGFEIFRIAVEIRHNWGLRNIDKDGDFGEIKTRAWEFLVKFRFN